MDPDLPIRAFDRVADRYDQMEQEFAFAPLRRSSLATLFSTFRQGKVVIDIGCGTGTESIALAKRGVTVIGIDPSESMILEAKHKAKSAKVVNVQFFQLAGRDLHLLPSLCGIHRFDGAYSSLGSLNCEPVIEPVKQALIECLNPGSPVVITLMNRWCAAEMIANVFTHPSQVFRRNAPFLTTSIGGMDVTFRIYSTKELVDAMKPFKKVRVKGLPVVVPPSQIGKKLPEDILQGLEGSDKVIASRWPFNRFGDYTTVTFVKK